jgi:hypothetical protein
MARKNWLRIGAIMVVLVVLAVATGRILYIDFPYSGRVIDSKTKRPIEGVAVVAVWWKQAPAAHPIITFHEAQETVTDSDGNFTTAWIWGGSINPLPRVRAPLFTIFKPGYEAFNERRFTSEWNPVPRWWRSVVELRRLRTRQERLTNASKLHVSICSPGLPEGLRVLPPYCIPREKIPNFLMLRNAERNN